MDQEHANQSAEPSFTDAVGDVVTGDVAGQALTEFSAEADATRELGEAPSFFGSASAGEAMNDVGKLAPLKLAGNVLTPLALDDGLHKAMDHKAKTDERIVGGANALSSGVGTLSEISDAGEAIGGVARLGKVGAAIGKVGKLGSSAFGSGSVMGVGGALVGSAAAGYGIGTEFNAISKESGAYGRNLDGKGVDGTGQGSGSNRSYSDMVGDDAFEADQRATDGVRQWEESSTLGRYAPDWLATAAGRGAGIGTTLGESAVGAVEATGVVAAHEAREVGAAAGCEIDAIGDHASDEGVAADEATQAFFTRHHMGAVAGVAGGIAGAGTVLGESAAGVLDAGGQIARAGVDAVENTAKDAYHATGWLWGEGKTAVSEGLHWLGL